MTWQVLRVDADTHHSPDDLPAQGWLDAVVPGGIGATPSLRDLAAEADTHAWWFRRKVVTGEGPQELRLDGVGTYAEVFLDGRAVASSNNAFRGQTLPLDVATGQHELLVRVAALAEVVPPRKPRARWRSSLLPDATMRWRRSPHLGRIPSWQGAAPYVGIVGEVTVGPARPRLGQVRLTREGTTGVVDVELTGPGAVVRIGDVSRQGSGRLEIAGARPWMPHTHGEPVTYELTVEHDGVVVETRRIGFCDIEIHDHDGVPEAVVEGRGIFVRGACWVPTDAATWVDDADRVRRDLTALREAGMNAVRLTGTNRYEPSTFWDIAAELGILVWQDVMLATFDPPEDDAWLAELEAELRDQLGRLQGRPNVLAVCGGTETEQQPTLMGVAAQNMHMTAVHDLLPRVATEVLPCAPHVVSSPSGGPRPVSIAEGFSHYFGVGAYLRPLDDARSARVAFASEALAFAIPPERATVRTDHPAGITDVRDVSWRDGVPSDRGVEWGFDDVTDHYVTALFGTTRADVEADRWLDLERAAVADALTSTLAVWRSPASPTGGAFVLSHADLRSGPGWGLLDHRGEPKAPLLALGDTLAPTALLLVDHGLDGLWLDVVHDGPGALDATLRLAVFAAGERPTDTAELAVQGPTRLHVETALGGFRDLTYAWRFGERYYRALHAELVDASGAVLATTTRLLAPPTTEPGDPGLRAEVVERTGTTLVVRVTAETLAEFVHLDAPGWRPTSGWFHLAPGQVREIRCVAADSTESAGSGASGTSAEPILLRATNLATPLVVS